MRLMETHGGRVERLSHFLHSWTPGNGPEEPSRRPGPEPDRPMPDAMKYAILL